EMTRDVVRVGAEVGAKVVAIESVREAITKGAAFYDGLWREYRSAYPARMWLLVNAYSHGLPQWRPRLFLVFAPAVFKPEWKLTLPPTIMEAIAGPAGEPVPPAAIYGGLDVRDLIFESIAALEPGEKLAKVSPDAVARRSGPEMADKVALIQTFI